MEVTGHRALIPHASPLLKPDAASEIHQARNHIFFMTRRKVEYEESSFDVGEVLANRRDRDEGQRRGIGRDADQAHHRARHGGLSAKVMEAIRDVTKLRGLVEVVLPGSLPNDGEVIEDARSYK